MNWRLYIYHDRSVIYHAKGIIIAAFIWAAGLSLTAQAEGTKYLLNCYTNDNLLQADIDLIWNPFIRINGAWKPAPVVGSGVYDWYPGQGTNLVTLPDDTYTIYFKRIQDFYVPETESRVIDAGHTADGYTNSYHIYSNSLSVVVTGITTSASARWQLTSYPDNEYTNSSFYSAHASGLFTNTSPLYSNLLSMIPTGTYSMAFYSVRGYQSPAAASVTITGAPYAWSTNITYVPYSNSLSVVMAGVNSTSKVSWTVSADNPDWTNMLSSGTTFTNTGSTPQMLSMIPTGTYTITFNNLTSYNPPTPNPVTTNITGALTPTVTGTYALIGGTLTVYIGAPFNRQTPQALPGIGGGTCLVVFTEGSYAQTVAKTNYTVAANDWVTLTANSLTNYVYKWYINESGTNASGISRSELWVNSCTFQMDTSSKAVWLLYSRPYNTYDNVGDIDQDKLPDRWETTWFGDGGNTATEAAPMAETNGNATANDDDDFIPSYDAISGYPLPSAVLLAHQAWELPEDFTILGYSKGVPFNNYYECRGLDGYYKTNVPVSFFPKYTSPDGDDPLTNPNYFDTSDATATPDTEGAISDGWKYYFWYWRSADAYNAGVTNGTNLSWVTWTRPFTIDKGKDTDGDFIIDGNEYGLTWTDPTHCDTDRDGTDDYWEIYILYPGANSNALDSANATNNPDGDFMAKAGALKHNAVYCMAPTNLYPGVCSFDPRTAWTNVVGTNRTAAPNTVPYTTYEEYLGGDGLGRISWDTNGLITVTNAADSTLPTDRPDLTPPRLGMDSDGDLIPDGWELYVGLNPNSAADAGLDSDSDKLSNLEEWANVFHPLGNCTNTWPNKLLPTDPGFITAPPPNDPHPKDTDWDGLTDNAEKTYGSNPTSWDTDADDLPDGWEIYAGTSITNSDARADLDGDGLLNWQEYWCGTVPEWQLCNPAWQTIRFCVRRAMPWDPALASPATNTVFIPPDYISDPCFMLVNNVYTDLTYLRTNYPAASAWSAPTDPITVPYYHTPLANNADSDGDGMDDYWEVYHGLNPCRGVYGLDIDYVPRVILFSNVEEPDADHTVPGYQFGLEGASFNSLREYIQYVEPFRNDPDSRLSPMSQIVGPFNLGLNGMDPDGDGLPNLEEYSYSRNRTLYHTDPTPIWRTDQNDTNSFAGRNYTFDMTPSESLTRWGVLGAAFPFKFEVVEGYDTDNDGVSDYAEINSAAGQTGNNPLDDRNPIRNRALYLNGTDDFTRQMIARASFAENTLTRFCVEAWIKPDNPKLARNQVVMEKAGLYDNPLDPGRWLVGANFRMGITNGLPYVLYNGRGSLRTYQATAQMKHQITSNTNWTHVAGSYDGTTLIIYVNGEESYSLRTTELPANGFDVLVTSNTFMSTLHTLMVGARDNNAGYSLPNNNLGAIQFPAPTNYFGGCVDEIRVWNGARSRAEILANKNRRLTQMDITNAMTSIYNYFTFDDVPDPNRSGEAVYPAGMADISFDMHPTIPWWRDYAMRSTIYTGITNSYNYVVYASDNAWHSRAIFPASDDEYHFGTNYSGTNIVITPVGYVNPGNPYYENYWNQNYVYDLLLFRGVRAVATNSWLSGLTSDPDSTDTDGDGLPDWWEQLYNLDPNDATGDNGAWGDVDNDGLNNRAEYLAGTNPRNSDTDGDGIGDYDSRSGPYTRTWGEMFMDGDGMPDVWEMQYGLDPYHYDANLDLDKDGWSNLAEYLAGTNPNDASSYPQPSVFGSADYFGNNSGTFRFFVYATNTMDGEPLITQVGAGQQVAETIGTADGQLYFSGRLPIYPIDQTTVVRVSAPAGTNSTTVTFTFTGPNTAPTYSGSGSDYSATLNYTTGKLLVRWASTEVPAAGANVSVDYTYANRNSAAFALTGFREGDFYLLALLGNDNTLDAGEAMGIMEGQPLTLGHTSLSGARIQLKDSAPGYGRFAWTANATGTGDYPIVINKISEQNAPTVLTRSMRWSRNYMHEWDYQIAGLYGLPNGNYQWWMGSQNGTFSVSWPAAVTTPALVYPRGDQLNYAVNQFKWTMDVNSTMYHLQVARKNSDSSLTFVLDNYYPTPYCDQNGVYQATMPLYAGELGNGVYYWRVASWSPAGESAWPEPQTFAINLSATNSHWIAGDIYYFGKADCANIIVEAFDNKGFSGKPDARVLLTGAVRSNILKGSFTLRGLEEGNYYVRAYLDVTPAGGTRDGKINSPWESYGFIRDPNNDYQPRTVALLDTMFIDGTKLVIRDQDTDNDLLPDAWEMFYFGNLDQTGDMDYDGDGETNLEEYMRDGVDMNPAAWDTDGDGLSDAFELNYTAPSFGFSAKSGIQLNPMLWDTDGDGYSDGAEMKRYHTDPLDPTSYPRYQPMCFDAWRAPGDYDGDGRTDLGVYDIANGNWYVMTAAGQFGNLPFGSSATQPMLGDYDGDGCDDFAVFEPATGAWHLYNAWTGQSFRLNFGDSEMLPVPADYDGDNKTDLAVYYPADGMWFIYSVWSGQFYSLKFGGPTCVPVPGDYNNDGAGDLATYEPNTGNWNIFAFDHYRHEGTYYSGNFGGPTMIPAGGDYDGDGRSDAALFEASTGYWYILTWKGQFLSGQFGGYGCIPAPGDYDGDGRTDICVYYPPTGTWYIYCWSGQTYQVQFGFASATPALKGR